MAIRVSQLRVIAYGPGSSENRTPPGHRLRDRSSVRLFLHAPERGISRRAWVLRIGRFILGGNAPRLELPLIDIGLTRTFITFPPGTPLVQGEIFEVVRPVRRPAEFTRPSRGLRKVVALVRIAGIEHESRARVEVLGGSLRRGVWAEKLDEHRIAARLYDFCGVIRRPFLFEESA